MVLGGLTILFTIVFATFHVFVEQSGVMAVLAIVSIVGLLITPFAAGFAWGLAARVIIAGLGGILLLLSRVESR
ncbi:MAG: hypothetical protein OXF41_11280 [bacterium]|nr:hypothetical protein [bacterium]